MIRKEFAKKIQKKALHADFKTPKLKQFDGSEANSKNDTAGIPNQDLIL